MEEALKERQEKKRNKQRRAKWDDRLGSAALRARIAKKEETDDAVRAAAMRARSDGHLNVFFDLSRDLEVTHLARLVEECLDDVRERAQPRGRSTGRSASQRGCRSALIACMGCTSSNNDCSKPNFSMATNW